MNRFEAAVPEFQWLLTHVIEFDDVLSMCNVAGLDRESTDQLLSSAGRFIAGAIAPISEQSDQVGARLENGRVLAPPGWKQAYGSWRESGWSALSAPQSHGGQGMPFLLQACVATMLGGADLGFAMVAVSARGASSVLLAHADADLAAVCVPRLANGEWTATIAITEAQAGSDVGLISATAARQPDGRFALTGTKIFISGGDHDLTEQILHIVLARTSGAAAGVKGLSLFLVPSRHFTPEGELHGRNSVCATRLEKKMGLHGSPTCELAFDAAEAILVGAEGAGLASLFTMMNELRIEVALNAVGISASATAHAIAYANERRQGRGPKGEGGPVVISHHPDVHRMLLIMQTLTDGGRALILEVARLMDLARLSSTAEAREHAKLRLEWLLPICKATLSENAVEIADIGIQVRGGHGFVRDSGAEQFFRDCRVLPIYEGTNGIHAIDLVTRKLQRGGGRAFDAFVQDIHGDLQKYAQRADLTDIHGTLQVGVVILETVSSKLLASGSECELGVLFGAKAYLDLAGRVAMCWMWLRMAAAATDARDAISEQKRALASFFAEYYEPEFHLHAARVLKALQQRILSSRAA